MLKQTLQRGFTLIELLVVIAIIGILAAVVLTSLSGAQEGAQGANVQQTVGSMKSAAQLYYNGNSFSYNGFCSDSAFTDPESDLIATISFVTDVTCGDGASTYAISAPVNADASEHYCVDSSGFSGSRSTAGISGSGSGPYTCPAS